MIERSLILLKPDAVQRGIVGEVLHRFERAGLKVVGAKLLQAKRETAELHYKKPDEWKIKVGNIRLDEVKNLNMDAMEMFGTTDALAIGEAVNQANFDFIVSGPIFAMVLEGVNAVVKIRTLIGETRPYMAQPGTIRGDFGLESPLSSMLRKRTIYNLIHASGTLDEAKEEIDLWFKPEEIVSYKRVHDDLYSY